MDATRDPVLEVIDLVAVAEPLELEHLVALAEPAAIEDAETRGLITVGIPRSQQAGREKQDGPHRREQRLQQHPHDAKGNGKQPQDRPHEEEQERERPANGEKKDPKEQDDDGLH